MRSFITQWASATRYTCLVHAGLTGVFCSSLVIGAEPVIYKTVEADGTVVFTDQKAPDAKVVNPSPLNVIASPDASDNAPATVPAATLTKAPETAETAENTEIEATDVTDVKLVSLSNGQTLIDPQEPFMVEIETYPAKKIPATLMAHLRLNGKLIATSQSTQMPLNGLERGTHSLLVQIVDQQGDPIAESNPTEIHVKRRSRGSNAQ